ncbi:hypothetical protein GCM10010495_72280 [Kitasatospora herbaricolor]|uniref:S8 family serine peptidase n=1 Tax=Kitasatospora herbaricolor TaxID=68217 RepID=UPI0017499844|nr:S8 family serine peptidase [Kitasatospora herbaricolor]MDQ0306764.1 cerevisin [Kitasatospora herbaricolor]GGV44407.1 hypothetical protein GCM10010495_72280 [Kitasatospora herbaricolor]
MWGKRAVVVSATVMLAFGACTGSADANVEKGAPWGLARISHKKPLDHGDYNKYIYDDQGGTLTSVYVLDSGINTTHEDFQGRARWGTTTVSGDANEDCSGHGSHLAGTVGGKKYGVAKKAEVVAVKVVPCTGTATLDDLIEGIRWAVKDKAVQLPRHEAERERLEAQYRWRWQGAPGFVILIGPHFPMSDRLAQEIRRAEDAGLFVVRDAGAHADASCPTDERVLTVGATTINDEAATFSDTGPCVDIFVPGKDIDSVWRGDNKAAHTLNGTDVAAAHAAGAAAYTMSLRRAPYAPADLKKKIIALSLKGVLGDLPKGTPDRLLYIDPPV